MLEKCSARRAQSIILLSDPLNPEEGAAQCIREMLAITKKLGVPGVDGIMGNVIMEVPLPTTTPLPHTAPRGVSVRESTAMHDG